jgi:cytochrome b561/polyisoprenoid-binding protein YceI
LIHLCVNEEVASMTPTRYSRTAMLLHWGIAAALAFQMGLGEAFDDVAKGKAMFDLAQFHKSIGITILLLSLIRLGVRFTKPRPAAVGDSGWAARLAGVTHFGLYAFMILAPLSGWIMISASKSSIPTYLFSAIPWPDFPFVSALGEAAKHNVHEVSETAHAIIAKLGLALFLLHVIGALRHQFLLKQPMIERMVPTPRNLSPLIGSGLIALLAATAFALLSWGLMPNVSPAANAALVSSAPAPVPAAAPAIPPDAALVPPTVAEPVKPETPAAEPLKAEEAAKVDPDAIAAGTTPVWTLAPGGRLGWTSSWSGAGINGSFGRWTSDIRFNPAALDKSKISVTVDLASVTSGDGERDSTLKSDDFFSTASHPKAVWTSGRIRSLGGNRYSADGSLSLRGVSRAVPLSFTLDLAGRDAKVSGGGTLNRTDFGVGQGDYAKTDEIPGPVAISFNFRAKRG